MDLEFLKVHDGLWNYNVQNGLERLTNILTFIDHLGHALHRGQGQLEHLPAVHGFQIGFGALA